MTPTKERANQKPRVLICDGFGHTRPSKYWSIVSKTTSFYVVSPLTPPTSSKPCDVAVFAPLKAAYRDQVNRLERAGTNTIGKEHFTSLYSPARERALTKKYILVGWAKCGLEPFSADRVLKGTPKPLTIPKDDEVKVGSCPQDDIENLLPGGEGNASK